MRILASHARLRARHVLLFGDWSDAGDHGLQFTGSQIPCPESMPKNHESWRATWAPATHLRLCRIVRKKAWPHMLAQAHREVALKHAAAKRWVCWYGGHDGTTKTPRTNTAGGNEVDLERVVGEVQEVNRHETSLPVYLRYAVMATENPIRADACQPPNGNSSSDKNTYLSNSQRLD